MFVNIATHLFYQNNLFLKFRNTGILVSRGKRQAYYYSIYRSTYLTLSERECYDVTTTQNYLPHIN